MLAKFQQLPLVQKLLGFVGISVILSGGFYFTKIRGAEGNVDKMKTAIKGLVRQENELSMMKFGEREKRVNDEIDRLEAMIEANQKRLPSRDQVAEFLTRIHHIASKDSGLDIARFTTGKKFFDKQYAKIPIKMEVSGDTSQLVRFFGAIADPNERLLTISDLSIRWTNPAEGEGAEVSNDKELIEAEKTARNAKLKEKHPELAKRLKHLLAYDLEQRHGRIEASFTLNAFTMITKEDIEEKKKK